MLREDRQIEALAVKNPTYILRLCIDIYSLKGDACAVAGKNAPIFGVE
jgi:hypothetical protein